MSSGPKDPTLSHANVAVPYLPIPMPYVFYKCGCNALENIGNHAHGEDEKEEPVKDVEEDAPKHPDFLSLFPIQRLFYCDYFPTASVKAERNRCARNCFECPICDNTLTVVSESDAGTSSLVGSSTSPTASISELSKSGGAGGIHYLSCSVCRWSSLEVGLQFERPTGLATQMQKLEESNPSPEFKEFEHLRDHFDRLSRRFNASASSQSIIRSQGSLSLSSNGGWEVQAYEGTGVGEEEVVEEAAGLKLEEVSSLPQRLQQLDGQPRKRSAKRCRKCDHILIKPEQKAQATRFKIKQMAVEYLPTITLVNHPNAPPLPFTPGTHPTAIIPPLQLGVAVHVFLKFTNPIDQPMHVELSTTYNAEVEEGGLRNCDVTLLAPVFDVPPFTEFMDDEERKSPEGGEMPGIVEVKDNGVIVESKYGMNRVEFPLLVRVTRMVNEPMGVSDLAGTPVKEGGTGRVKVEKMEAFWWVTRMVNDVDGGDFGGDACEGVRRRVKVVKMEAVWVWVGWEMKE
ncbi:dynactin p62 family-domain-containing protein [Chytridium lagenaria]|nr:dynactin p62 family-domain-containing protein [Chytridium lagenaria]